MTDDPVYDDVAQLLAERRELMRVAAVLALDRKDLDPDYRAWAEHYAAVKPLCRPLSNGEPGERVGVSA